MPGGSVIWRAACALLAVGLALTVLSHWRTSERAEALALALSACGQARAADMATWARESRDSEARERAREQAAQAAVEKERRDGIERTQAAERRASGLAAAADRLRQHVEALAARGAGDPGPAPEPAAGGETAPVAEPVRWLLDLYRSTESEARELAVALDAARTAGLACERIHDSLTRGNGGPDRQH